MEVQRALEDSLPELEALLEHGILSQEEVKTLVSKRREFESRLRRFELLKEDGLEYIGFEVNLHKLVEKRKLRLNVRQIQHASKRTFIAKVNLLFDILLKKFKADLDLWVAAIEFSQSVMDDSRVSLLCGKGIRLFPTREMFWVMAAKHELERNGNVTQARQVLITALKTLPRNETIWVEYFRMEFLFVNQVLERREVQGLELVSPHDDLLRTVFDNAIVAVPNNAAFQLEFLRVCNLFAETRRETSALVRDYILDSLERNFPEDKRVLAELLRADRIKPESKQCAAWFELQLELLAGGGEGEVSKMQDLCAQAKKLGVFNEEMALLATTSAESSNKRQRIDFTNDFPQSAALWERRCEVDESAMALARKHLPPTSISLRMWQLELERHPARAVEIIRDCGASLQAGERATIVSHALLQHRAPSELVRELERSGAINLVPEECFEAVWQHLCGEGGLSVEETRSVLEQWVQRYPAQRSYQCLIGFERERGGKREIKPLLFRALGAVPGFKLE